MKEEGRKIRDIPGYEKRLNAVSKEADLIEKQDAASAEKRLRIKKLVFATIVSGITFAIASFLLRIKNHRPLRRWL